MSKFLKQGTRSLLIVGLVSVFGLGIASTSIASDDGAKSDHAAQKAQDHAAKDAEKAAKEAQKAQEKAAKDAEKAAKEAQKAQEKAAKEAEKAQEKAAKDAEKDAKDAAKDAEKAAKDAEKCQKYAAKGKVKKGCVAPDQTAGTPAPAAPQLVVLGQTLRPCTSRRVLKIRIARHKGLRYRSATVTMNGKRIATRKGKRITAPINLTGLPKGTYRIIIRVKTTKGKVLKGTRTYHTCVAKRPMKRAPKL